MVEKLLKDNRKKHVQKARKTFSSLGYLGYLGYLAYRRRPATPQSYSRLL